MRLAGILLFLFVGGSILLAGVAIVLSAVFLGELWRFDRMRRRQPNARSAFGRKLLRRLANNAIKDISEVYNSYRAFLGIEALKASHLEEIAEFLRRATSRTASSPRGPAEGRLHENTKVVEELLAANQRALEVELQCLPFSGTPEPERQLLEEILELTAEDKQIVSAKLDLLAKAIRIRQDTVERLDRESGRSLRLARWGWFGTVGFSILSIILGILSLGG